MSANFESIYALIADAVADAQGDSLIAELKLRKRIAADPDLRAAVTDALMVQGIRRIAQDLESDYPMDPTITF